MGVIVRMLRFGEAAILGRVAPGVFDDEVDLNRTAEFLADSRHHLAVAIDGGELVVGMASALHYVHPDKGPTLWINEIGVAPTHQGSGLGRRLLETLFEHGRALGCREGWVATEPGNHAARRLYASAGGVESAEGFVMAEFKLAPES